MPNKHDTDQPSLSPALQIYFDEAYPHAVDGFSEQLRKELHALGALGTKPSAERPAIE